MKMVAGTQTGSVADVGRHHLRERRHGAVGAVPEISRFPASSATASVYSAAAATAAPIPTGSTAATFPVPAATVPAAAASVQTFPAGCPAGPPD